MAKRSSKGEPEAKESRVQLGDYWLEWRAEREQWCIAWYDPDARTRRRRSTGIGGGEPDNPPEEARRALAEHYLECAEPEEPKPAAEATVADMLTFWLNHHVRGLPIGETGDGFTDDDAMAMLESSPVAKDLYLAARSAYPDRGGHETGLSDQDRYAFSAKHWLRFFARERKLGKIVGGATVSDINNRLIDRFIAFRKSEGVGGHTISRDLAALRGALSFNWRQERLAVVPFVKDVDKKDKAKPRDLVYSMEQVAAILEAAWGRPDRQHVFLYCMIALSTCGRSEAILDLHDHQLDRGLIYFLDPDRDQTSKRRSVVPVAPTLAPWLEGIEGKLIKYRAPIAEAKWADPGQPEYFERDCYDVGNAFNSCLIDAGICNQVLDAKGQPVMLPARPKLGETESRPKLRGKGTPNTLRHTIITEMHSRGVDERQIDMAAGHAPIGTGKRNYMHLRPDFLAELIEAVEAYWAEMRRYTTVHLRSHCGPTVVSFAQAQAGRRSKNG